MESALRTATAAGAVVLDRYELSERLGEGGFGAVWLAHDLRLDRPVAVKRVPVGDNEETARRAEREALTAARLSHPAIVALFEAGRDDEAVYLVSELVRGATLGDLLREGALSDRDVLEIGIAVSEALSHAHSHGVIHRDVKPGNVLIPDVPTGVPAKLTDFGIASVLDGDAITATGDVVGTLAYMAPEQAEGRQVSAAADVYSLGLVLYEALSGVNPVRQGGAAATARRVGMRMPALRRLRRDLPRDLCDEIDAAVSGDPRDRCTLAALRGALERSLAEVGDEPGEIAAPRLDVLARSTAAHVAVARTVTWNARRALDLRREDPLGAPPHAVREDAWEADGDRARRAHRVPLPARAASALLTAALVCVLLPLAPTAPYVDPVAAGAIAAAVTIVLPRAGWLAVALAVGTWLAANGAPGVTVAVAAAAAPVPLLLARASAWWSAPFLGVGLGILGVAGAWPAIAGQARGAIARASLGAIGWWWIALAECMRGDRLLTGPGGPASGDALAAWSSIRDVATTATSATAALWAAGALVLPWVVRGRSAALDLLAAAAWTAAIAITSRSIATAAGAGEPRGLVGAAALAALLAVCARAFARRP